MNAKKRVVRVLMVVSMVAGLLPIAGPALAVSPDVVISQVYGGGGNSGATLTNDFIELFNRGTTTIDITGWSVQYASATGTSWQVTTLSGSLAPGQYYLVQEAAGAGGTTVLPTPDASGSIAMSATNGKVALANTATPLTGSCSTAVVDLVGYGSANCFEGAGAAPALSNTTAAIRFSDGCIDTDDNNADFLDRSAQSAEHCFTSDLMHGTHQPLGYWCGGPRPGRSRGQHAADGGGRPRYQPDQHRSGRDR